MRTAFVRGLAATWSSPVIVRFTVGWVAVEWFVLALGFPGPMHSSPSPQPCRRSARRPMPISVGIFGGGLGLPLVLVVSAVHALWQSLLVGLAIEAVESVAPLAGARSGDSVRSRSRSRST